MTKNAPSSWQPPPAFDGYRLVKVLGRGAMGEVYLAEDTQLERLVAVKFVAGVMPDETRRKRFRTEAQAIARVQHPNVLNIYRAGEVEHHPYLVSEFLRGESLDLLKKPQPWPRVLDLGIGLARGLAAAHRRGVLHRDIKPANAILTEEGQVKLLDFGVAKLLDATGGHSALLSASPAPRDDEEEEGEGTVDLPEAADRPSPTGVAAALPSPNVTGRIGTPRYMAPEVWRGEPATARSDLYSLGVLLYELCSNATPHEGSTRQALREAVEHRPAVPLAQVAPEVDPAFASIIARCLARSPAERFSSAEELREALEALQENTREEAGPRERPYPGLHPFTAQDRATFFGRASSVRTLLDRLRAESLVLVAGDSGVGKSSLCRAGVVPRVAEGALGLGGAWAVCEVLPGRQPLLALAAALSPLVTCQEAQLLEELRQAPLEVGRRARGEGGTRGLLVFVDQLEELVTLAEPGEAERFSLALEALASSGPRLRVLATARSDFLVRLAALPGLGDRLASGLYLLPHLSEAGLREAVVAPARAQGYAFESEALVDTLVAAGGAEGGLPLLQFALAELWERRDREQRVVPAQALAALGGVEGALARHADGVLAGLRPGQQVVARRLLLRLVLAEGTRARRTRAELLGEGGAEEGEARAALEALVRGRLVLAREAAGDAGAGTYELAHEALLRGWDTLRGWLASGEELRALRQRLERASGEWRRLGKVSEQLWSARQLAEAARLGLAEEAVSAVEVEFLRASRRAVWRRRLGRAMAVLLLPLTAAGVYGGLELRARQARELKVTQALALAERALSVAREKNERAEALRSQAFHLFDTGPREEAEPTWAQALALGAEERRAYEDAAEVLEAALATDSQHLEVRHQLSKVLYRYILLAERDRHAELRPLLIQRLVRVDDAGQFRLLLVEPASLFLESDPPGAEVLFERAVDEGGRLRWSEPQPLGTTPIQGVPLAPGSYRLTFRRPDRPAVLYPVLLGRAERFQARIPLPTSIPSGYVYVPPGRFLFGSSDDERVRRYLVRTRPIHELATGGFLIARHEVTYSEWLSFLRTLPPAERVRRRPHGANYFGTIETVEQPDGSWNFVLKRQMHTYNVPEGAQIEYLDRTHHARQDWLRFPVSSISWEDAQAYLAWLDRTGRLPGARMCNEREWERAARGADGRDFPHGNQLEPGDANFDETYGRKARAFGPDEVGLHPASDSPFGVADLAGNVWEWMVTATQPESVAYGGGSFYQDSLTARSLNHGDGERGLRWPFIGLRVCAPAPDP